LSRTSISYNFEIVFDWDITSTNLYLDLDLDLDFQNEHLIMTAESSIVKVITNNKVYMYILDTPQRNLKE
jgi:hypothetical protein